MKQRLWAAVAGVGLLLTLVSGCGGAKSGGSTAPSGGTAPQTIKIGFVGPLSGDSASYGQMAKRSMDLALEELNSKGVGSNLKLDVNFYDDAGDPKQAVAGALKFADDKNVLAMFPSALSGNSLAMVPILDKAHLPTVAYSSSAPSLYGASPYFFRVCGNDAQYGVMMAQYAKEKLNAKTATVVYVNNDYGKLLKDTFMTEADRLGVKVVSSPAYLATDREFASILTEIKAKNPDVIALSSTYTDAGLLVKQARSMGITTPFVGPGGLNNAKFLELAGPAAEGTVIYTVFAPDTPASKVQDYAKKFQAKYNMAPDQAAAIAYDDIYVVADAIARAQKAGELTREGIQKALKTTSFDGINGKISFNEKGDWVRPYPYLVAKDGKFVSPK